jgi:DEAD/DEAH box helicase domain-containing protein
MVTEIIFDIETKKLFQDITTNNPADLGVSIVSAYKRTLDDNFKEISGEMTSFWEADFPQMWSYFSDVDRVIGFNSLGFDVPALDTLCPYNFKKLTHFDMMAEIKNALGFRLSLNALASETIGHTKIDVGTNAPLYWAQATVESLNKLKTYCEADVAVTRDLYDYGLKYGNLKYKDKWNTPRMVEINFSYPVKTKNNIQQIELF